MSLTERVEKLLYLEKLRPGLVRAGVLTPETPWPRWTEEEYQHLREMIPETRDDLTPPSSAAIDSRLATLGQTKKEGDDNKGQTKERAPVTNS